MYTPPGHQVALAMAKLQCATVTTVPDAVTGSLASCRQFLHACLVYSHT